MKYLFTLIIFLLVTNETVFAQKSNIFKVPLEIDPRVSPPGRLFAIDTVVNIRADTSARLGTWQRPSGKNTELQFKEGFQSTLTNFVFAASTNFDNKLPFYALLIQEFDITSVPNNSRFELAVTFSKRDSLQRPGSRLDSGIAVFPFKPVFVADIIIENSTSNFDDLIKQGLTKAFLKFNNFLADSATVSSIYSDFAIEAAQAAKDLNLTLAAYDSVRTGEDNLLRCNQFRPGVYQNFNELIQNRPSLTGSLAVQQKNDFATLRKSSGSRAKHRFFGFCDGQDLFISTRLYQNAGLIRRYAKVKSIGRYLLWIDNYVTTAEMTANAAAGAAFGLLGALVASSASSTKDCIALDMHTGGVFMVTKDKLSAMLAGHDDLLGELAAMPNPKDEQQQFYLVDKLNQRIRTLVAR